MTPTATPPKARQAITGLMPPALGEAQIRTAFPTLLGVMAAPAALAKALTRTYVLVPFAWLIQAPLFGLKFAPFVCKRYVLTNRRLVIKRGWKPDVVQEVPLAEIDEVRIVPGSLDDFYLSGDLEVIARGQVVMRLAGVPEPEGFRHAIINSVKAWVPSKATGAWIAASADVEGK